MKRYTLSEDISVVQGRDGWFMANRHDTFVGHALELYGEYAGIELQTLQSMLRPGDRVIEVGANIGSHTVGLAKVVGPGGMVYAYEPQRTAYAMLQGQIALNTLTQVSAFNLGCGAAEGVFWYTPQEQATRANFGAVTLSPAHVTGKQPVRVMPLDKLHEPSEPIRLVKIDVEGMETEVIAGARGLIAAQRPILYVENDRPEKSKALLEAIFALGYRAWWHIPPLFNPANYFGFATNVFGEARSINMACVHKSITLMGSEQLREISLSDPHPAGGA